MDVLRADSAEAWHRLCSTTFVPLDAVASDVFTGQIEHMSWNGISVSRVTCAPCQVGRSRRTIQTAPRPDVLINVVEEGFCAIDTPAGRSVLVEGQAVLCEANAEYQLVLTRPATVLTMRLDRSDLPIADIRIHSAHGVPMRSTARVTVLRHYLSGLLAGSAVGLDQNTHYVALARDLLIMALQEHDDITSTAEGDSAYVLIRSLLERQFTDPDLTIDLAARRLRISRRYVENVFARNGHSPAAYLRSLRVDRARAILINSTAVGVAEAGRLAGFSDAATFTRVFRRATGLPPSIWRQRQLVDSGASSGRVSADLII